MMQLDRVKQETTITVRCENETALLRSFYCCTMQDTLCECKIVLNTT